MYIPTAFVLTDDKLIDAFVQRHSFGLIISAQPDGEVMTTALPLIWDRGGMRLEGHLARANPHAKLLTSHSLISALFSGPHAYVSPRWYKNEPNVPTWNYVMIKMVGRIQLYDDPVAAEDAMARLSHIYEGDSWRFKDLPDQYRAGMLKGIYPFRIQIERIEAKAKMSQNRKPEDIEGAIKGLRMQGGTDDLATAEWMERLAPTA